MLPYIIINVAMSLNGKISSGAGRYPISGIADMERVKILRGSVDAVLVGANTVMIDEKRHTVSRRRNKFYRQRGK